MLFYLKDICGLPIGFDDLDHKMCLDKEVSCNNVKRVSINSLHPTLINKAVCYPITVYEEYSINVDQTVGRNNSNIKFDIVVIPPGLLGIEFIKSHIFYVPLQNPFKPKVSCVVEGIKGETTVIMQKIGYEQFDGRIQPYVIEGVIVKLNPKEKIVVNEGYYYTFVNTSDETNILSRVYKNYGGVDYNVFGKMNGLAYLCIRKNAKQEVVYNPKYRRIPDVRFSTPEENQCPGLEMDVNKALYDLIKTNTETFHEFLID